MAAFRFLFIMVISIVPAKIYAQGPLPPQVTGSYMARGEMVETLEDESKLLMQMAFEESYDADTQNAAFNAYIMGKNVTYYEHFSTNQTFKYTEGKDCQQVTVEEWIDTNSPPSLLKYEDTNGTVRFSLKQLFSMDKKHLKEYNMTGSFRGIPARYWMYEIRGTKKDSTRKRLLNVYSYWSDGSYKTTSNEDSVPLGFIVRKMSWINNKAAFAVHEQFINVFAFVPNAINQKLFEPIQGVVCKNKTSIIAFHDVTSMQAIALHSEVIFPDYQEIKYVDTWFDPLNKMIRIDSERNKDEDPTERKSLKYQSEMVLGKSGVVFKLSFWKDFVSCTAVPIKDYDLDIQNLFNFKQNLKDWNIGKLFGLNQTSYTYIGKTTKRDIPCHLFQGIRTDWPEPSAKVESLWEWCFSLNITTTDDAVIFRNREYGLINAQVTILKSAKPSDLPPNYRIIHHFYDVNRIQPFLLDSTNFHIGHCFTENQKRRLQFVIDWEVTDDSFKAIENATSDMTFINKWKATIYQNADLDPNMLRISGVKADIIDKKLILKFTILSPHPSLPDDILRKQKSSFTAENNLRDKINDRLVFIYYSPKKGAANVRIGALPHSLKFQINTTFQPHVLPTTTPGPDVPTGDTLIPFTLLPDPNDDRTTSDGQVTGTKTHITSPPGKTTMSPGEPTSKPHKDHLKDPRTLHRAGTVATVSIAMLLVGVTIGSTGIFIKYNGLPQCLRFTTFV